MSVDFGAVGLAVGHASDPRGITGVTVLRGVDGAVRGAACVFGRATGTRELETLDPTHHAGRVDAIMLTGSSAYGLDAAAGVMRWLEERKRGFEIGPGVVPIVPAAVIFDLGFGDFKTRPTPDMAYAACDSAKSRGIAEGSVGVGTGATVGKAGGPTSAMKGGFGLASRTSGDATVCAAVVVNALGDVRDASGTIIAGARAPNGGFLDSARVMSQYAPPSSPPTAITPQHTTLCVVATNVVLERSELAQLARAAGAALFRRITPVGTSFDGDVVFALCPPTGKRGALMPLELNAVAALEEAIERGVRLAKGRDGIPGLADRER